MPSFGLHFFTGRRMKKVCNTSISYQGLLRAALCVILLMGVVSLVHYSFFLNRKFSTVCPFTDQITDAIVVRAQSKKSSSPAMQTQGEKEFEMKLLTPEVPQLSADDFFEKHFPNMVFYVWCGKRSFEFHNYLSVLSVIKFLQPLDILFYYETYPVIDKWLYNTWFDELVETYPFLQQKPITPLHEACNSNDKPNKAFIYHILSKSGGGMYIDSDVVLTSSLDQLKAFDIVLALRDSSNSNIDFMLTKFGYLCNSLLTSNFSIGHNLIKLNTELIQCPHISNENEQNDTNVFAATCAILSKRIYPKSIWQLDNSFGRLARFLFYGHPKIPLAVPTANSKTIPKIGHMVWNGGGAMDFTFYLGVLSMLHIAQMKTVYIHGDQPPTGVYWNLITSREKRVVYVHRIRPSTIYGQIITSLRHISDIWRADILSKFGGVYMDTDAVFVKQLDDELFNYDAVASLDWPEWNKPWPDVINMGVTMGKRGAPYWKLFQESMKWFRDNDFGWNGIRRPYQVFERHPDMLKIDPHLQVICYLNKCHPTWWPDYHKDEVHHLLPGRIFDWQNDTYALHWTDPTPYEFEDHYSLLNTDSMFASVGKFILRKSNMLEYFENIVDRAMIVDIVDKAKI